MNEAAIVQQTRDKVLEILQGLFDEPYSDAEDGRVYVRYGSTVLEIGVQAYGEDEAVVQVVAYCVQGVETGEDLLLGLLELNYHLPLGAFSLVGDDVFFSYGLPAKILDPKGLLAAIAAVANISDEYDDRITAKFGGQTALERINEIESPQRDAAD